MYRMGKYKRTDPMSVLVCKNYPILLVMSRFGIPLGFGDKTIEEVCVDNKVDVDTFLAIINFLLDEDHDASGNAPFSIEAMMRYLHNSHDYFLHFRLPTLRRNLLEAIDCGPKDVSVAILSFFDEYVTEVQKHMLYEEQTVFPYVRALLEEKPLTKEYNIGIFSKRHDQVEAKLGELKNILIKYYPAKSSNELNAVLFDIFACEEDLASHNYIEDFLFVPAIQKLELKRGRNL
ncbi:MAG: hemerythrin domain-containing protein [Porphyromonadaceae bacterium]|nr:hemerythrin domain-containing protein [Porphyromonadaceae bacterium]MCD8287240.1 hemerythrin domain-containing protein [Porphyromonadaceae bacterium]